MDEEQVVEEFGLDGLEALKAEARFFGVYVRAKRASEASAKKSEADQEGHLRQKRVTGGVRAKRA